MIELAAFDKLTFLTFDIGKNLHNISKQFSVFIIVYIDTKHCKLK